LLSIAYLPLSAQFYFTGEVKGPHDDLLQGVYIIVRSTGEIYRTGSSGSFEIMTRKTDDSLTFSVEGYENYSTTISSNEFLRVTLKERPVSLTPKKDYVSSVVDGPSVSFSCNSNGITYSNIRRFLNMGMPVPPEAVKVEEMLNYLNFYYEDPEEDHLFHCSSDLLTCPWDVRHRILCLNICAKKAAMENAPPANLVFLIDVTGSMDMPNKLPLIKSALHLLVKNLRDIDTISFIEYGGRGRILAGVPGSEKERLIRAIEQLSADGPPPGDAGFNLAYRVAASQYIPHGNNRVILITDGDISSSPAARHDLVDLVHRGYNDSIRLSCLAVGLKKEETSELSQLAAAGNGTFNCIEDAQQAERLLLDHLAKGLSGIADKVCFTVSFDTSIVQEYRLLGFDSRHGTQKDTAFRFEGSSIASANAQLVLFEIIPKKDSIGIENLANVHIDYCLPGQSQIKKMSYDCPNKPGPFETAPPPLKKAVCIALFGMKLKGSEYTAQFSWADIDKMTKKVFSSNNYIDRDYMTLMARARKIYEHAQ
jgi:Ca-activated chloride channel family protein